MDYLNKELSQIRIFELCILISALAIVVLIIEEIFQIVISDEWVFVVSFLFIFYKLRNCGNDLKKQFKTIFYRFSFKNILLIVLINIFFSLGILFLINSIESLFSFSVLSSLKASSVLLGMISPVIISPIFEELLFRGIILPKLNKYFSLVFSILVSSILFGLMHDAVSIFGAFIFGICMCILYIESNNILVPIFAHFLNNLVAEIFMIIDPNEFAFTYPFILIFYILAIISTGLLLLLFYQFFKVSIHEIIQRRFS